jgi:hypothetical protein
MPLTARAAGEVATVGEVKHQVHDTPTLHEIPSNDHLFQPRKINAVFWAELPVGLPGAGRAGVRNDE